MTQTEGVLSELHLPSEIETTGPEARVVAHWQSAGDMEWKFEWSQAAEVATASAKAPIFGPFIAFLNDHYLTTATRLCTATIPTTARWNCRRVRPALNEALRLASTWRVSPTDQDPTP